MEHGIFALCFLVKDSNHDQPGEDVNVINTSI